MSILGNKKVWQDAPKSSVKIVVEHYPDVFTDQVKAYFPMPNGGGYVTIPAIVSPYEVSHKQLLHVLMSNYLEAVKNSIKADLKAAVVAALGPEPDLSAHHAVVKDFIANTPVVWNPIPISGATQDQVLDTLKKVIPNIDTLKAKHPVSGGSSYLLEIIISLNDYHKWTREQIADWLETLDLDLRFQSPGEEVNT